MTTAKPVSYCILRAHHYAPAMRMFLFCISMVAFSQPAMAADELVVPAYPVFALLGLLCLVAIISNLIASKKQRKENAICNEEYAELEQKCEASTYENAKLKIELKNL